MVATVRSQFTRIWKGEWIVPAAHGAVGVGIASWGSGWLSRQTGVANYGWQGVALSAGATGLGTAVIGLIAQSLPKGGMIGKCCKGIVGNVFVGGMIATAIRAAYEIIPGFASQYLPRVSAPVPLPASNGAADTAGIGAYGYGHYPGQYPSWGPLGMVESPEQLVASESFSRQVNQLAGMGQPVPVEDIADWMQLSGGGYQPMRDWVEFTPGSPYAQMATQGDPGFPGPQGF